MATTPAQLQFTQEVPTAVTGDTVPNAPVGSLLLFPSADVWYAKTAAGVVTALSGVTNVTATDTTITVTVAGTTRTIARAAITGDITIAAGSNAAVLPNVNANTGSFGTASNVAQVTLNAKGQATAAVNVPIAITSGAVSGLTFFATLANLSGDISTSGSGVTTLPVVNANVGSFGSASAVATQTVNAKGQTTAAATVPIAIANTQVSGLGTLSTQSGTFSGTHSGASSGTNTGDQTLGGLGGVPTSRLINTTAPLAGGGNLSGDLTLNMPAATTTTAGHMPAASQKIISSFALGIVNIVDYGADTTGVTPITTALNNAVAAFGGAGGVVMFPPGSYLENTAPYIVAANNIKLWAPSGANSTVIKTSNTTGDQLRLTGYGCAIEGFSIQGPGTGTTSNKTAGIGLDIQSTEGRATGCSFAFHFDACRIGGTLVDVDDLWVRYFKANGIVVDQNSDHRITRVSMVNNAATLPTGAGIDVRVTASLVLEQLNIIASNFALNLSPTIGVTIPSIKGTDCFFDTSAVGVRMAGAGSVLRSEFTNCWFSSMSTAGIMMTPATAGGVDGITFTNCDIYNNVAGTTNGVLTNTNVGKWKMVGCSIAGWTNGVNLVAGSLHYPTMVGNTIGAVSAFTANGTGIAFGAGTYKGLMLSNNDVVDNTAVQTGYSGVVVSAANAGLFRVVDNPGLNPIGVVTTPAVAASTVAMPNLTGVRVLVRLSGGTVTAYTVNGVATGLVAAATLLFPLEPGSTLAITYSVVPTMKWIGQ